MIFKELFIKYLTEDIIPEHATAIFNKENGLPEYKETRLDMVLQVYDDALKEFSKENYIKT